MAFTQKPLLLERLYKCRSLNCYNQIRLIQNVIPARRLDPRIERLRTKEGLLIKEVKPDKGETLKLLNGQQGKKNTNNKKIIDSRLIHLQNSLVASKKVSEDENHGKECPRLSRKEYEGRLSLLKSRVTVSNFALKTPQLDSETLALAEVLGCQDHVPKTKWERLLDSQCGEDAREMELSRGKKKAATKDDELEKEKRRRLFLSHNQIRLSKQQTHLSSSDDIFNFKRLRKITPRHGPGASWPDENQCPVARAQQREFLKLDPLVSKKPYGVNSISVSDCRQPVVTPVSLESTIRNWLTYLQGRFLLLLSPAENNKSRLPVNDINTSSEESGGDQNRMSNDRRKKINWSPFYSRPVNKAEKLFMADLAFLCSPTDDIADFILHLLRAIGHIVWLHTKYSTSTKALAPNKHQLGSKKKITAQTILWSPSFSNSIEFFIKELQTKLLSQLTTEILIRLLFHLSLIPIVETEVPIFSEKEVNTVIGLLPSTHRQKDDKQDRLIWWSASTSDQRLSSVPNTGDKLATHQREEIESSKSQLQEICDFAVKLILFEFCQEERWKKLKCEEIARFLNWASKQYIPESNLFESKKMGLQQTLVGHSNIPGNSKTELLKSFECQSRKAVAKSSVHKNDQSAYMTNLPRSTVKTMIADDCLKNKSVAFFIREGIMRLTCLIAMDKVAFGMSQKDFVMVLDNFNRLEVFRYSSLFSSDQLTITQSIDSLGSAAAILSPHYSVKECLKVLTLCVKFGCRTEHLEVISNKLFQLLTMHKEKGQLMRQLESLSAWEHKTARKVQKASNDEISSPLQADEEHSFQPRVNDIIQLLTGFCFSQIRHSIITDLLFEFASLQFDAQLLDNNNLLHLVALGIRLGHVHPRFLLQGARKLIAFPHLFEGFKFLDIHRILVRKGRHLRNDRILIYYLLAQASQLKQIEASFLANTRLLEETDSKIRPQRGMECLL